MTKEVEKNFANKKAVCRVYTTFLPILLEFLGLIIVRLLVASDNRLKQLFNRHGGPQLLLSMVQYTSGLLKQEVSATLKSVSKGTCLFPVGFKYIHTVHTPT